MGKVFSLGPLIAFSAEAFFTIPGSFGEAHFDEANLRIRVFGSVHSADDC